MYVAFALTLHKKGLQGPGERKARGMQLRAQSKLQTIEKQFKDLARFKLFLPWKASANNRQASEQPIRVKKQRYVN